MISEQRTFLPGSRWLYFKLYTGIKTADDLLLKEVRLLVKLLKKKSYLDKWFFIRYTDPDFHLRVRFLLHDHAFVGEVFFLIHKRLSKCSRNNLLRKVQFDTYNREIERYREVSIEGAEAIFDADSSCILSIIHNLNKNENYRWMIAVRLIDSLLSDFNFNLFEKQDLMISVSSSYKTEFGFTEYNSKQFNSEFRKHKLTIESVMHNKIKDECFNVLYASIEKRSEILMPIIQQIESKRNNEKISKLTAGSFLHMMLNRLFISKNRLHELVLYDYMRRYYTSEIAKLRFKG